MAGPVYSGKIEPLLSLAIGRDQLPNVQSDSTELADLSAIASATEEVRRRGPNRFSFKYFQKSD
jgi:hypothetical protein